MSPYHREWNQLITGKGKQELIDYLVNTIVEPVLRRNAFYIRCEREKGAANSGICLVMKEFKAYLQTNQNPSEAQIRLFGELAYTLWVLGNKLVNQYDTAVQRRVNEFFKGNNYYGDGKAGFRQFEYELQTICRLVEEGIAFQDDAGEGDPDLTVRSAEGPFRLEIKLPIANPVGALNKALRQLTGGPGVVLISLDNVLADINVEDREEEVMRIAALLRQEIGLREDVAVMVEFYTDKNATSQIGWIGPHPSAAVVTMFHALDGSQVQENQLPPSLA